MNLNLNQAHPTKESDTHHLDVVLAALLEKQEPVLLPKDFAGGGAILAL